MVLLSGFVVVAFGLYLSGLASLAFFDSARAERFLRLFASSARAHYAEQALRFIVGAALVVFSQSMWFSTIFQMFGWIMVVSALGLLVVPWRWHHRFAEWVVPMAIRHMRWFGMAALVLGVFVFYGTTRIVFV